MISPLCILCVTRSSLTLYAWTTHGPLVVEWHYPSAIAVLDVISTGSAIDGTDCIVVAIHMILMIKDRL